MMKRAAVAAFLGLCAAPAAAIDVPSGQPVELWEVLIDEVGVQTWLRFRFLAPEISQSSGSVSFDVAEGDIEALCSDVALPYMVQHNLAADVVVINLLDRPVAFGVSDPEATQYVDAFRPDGETCLWGEL